MHGMVPTQQRFHADDGACAAGNDRLVVEPELFGFERGAQIYFDRAALLDLLGHFGGEQHGAVAALVLGLVERDVGVAHQLIGGDAVVRRHGKADRGGHANALAIDRKGRCEGLRYAFRERRLCFRTRPTHIESQTHRRRSARENLEA